MSELFGMTENLEPMPKQNTFLFIWNPKMWSQWMDPNNEPYIEKNIEELNSTGKVVLKWNCQSHKAIKLGDRAFLARVGSDPKGIFGSGKVVSEPFLSNR